MNTITKLIAVPLIIGTFATLNLCLGTLTCSAQSIAVGDFHSLAVCSDGAVRAFGKNTDGQLGDGTNTSKSTPVQVSGITNITAVAAGWDHSLALKNDGTVYACGRNWKGQLGDGTTIDRWVPVQVNGLTGAAAVAGGERHSLALKNDGTLWAWGGNSWGNLGNGTLTQSNIPIQIVAGIAAIAGGAYYSLAVKNDGTMLAWGFNGFGQLGDGTTAHKYSPVQVNGLCTVLPTVIDEISTPSPITIFPNPSIGKFQIAVNSSRGSMNTMDIYNLIGEKVYSSIINNHSLLINLDVPDGIYFISVRTAQENIVKKLIIGKR